MNGDLYLGTTTLLLQLLTPFGRTFRTGIIKLFREERTASGRLVRDVYATKKIFTLSYSMIDGDELEIFENLLAEDSELIFRSYTKTGYTDYTVLIDPFEKERLLLLAEGLYGNVEIVLNEV